MSTGIIDFQAPLLPSTDPQATTNLPSMLPTTTVTKRAFKRRAPKACGRCRIRKVRCDIVLRGNGCTNCALDEVECIDTLSRRQAGAHKKSMKRQKAKEAQIAAKTFGEEVDDTSPFLDNIAALPDLLSPPTTAITFSPEANCQENLGVSPHLRHTENHFPDFTMGLLSEEEVASCTESHSSPSTNLGHPKMMRGVDVCQNNNYGLPSFILPIESAKCAQHWFFLHCQGAFDVLHEELRNAIITSYVHFIHPQLPVLDIHELLQALATNGRDCKVSLLLLQAILLSGCTFVEMEYVTQAGFESRMSLRRQLADRVRLLYDFDCEPDRLILVQSLTLMTSWQEYGDEVKHLRHWIGIAYNISIFIGLNKDPESSSLPLHRKHLWKRVWWSCYMKDRMLAFGLRHAPIIPTEECQTPDLTLDDFDIELPTSEVSSVFSDCGLLLDIDQQKRLAEVCIAQQKLCHKLSEVLKARYETIAPKLGCTTTRTLVSVPKTSSTNTPEIQKCASGLTSWYRDLPSRLRYQVPTSLQFGPEQHLLMFHCALLNLLYYALICILQRPWPSPISQALPASEICSQRKSRLAANAISSILRDLQGLEMIHLLPTSGITFILQAAVVHLADSATGTSILRSKSKQQLESCLEFLDDLMEVHSYSTFAKSFIVSAAAKLYHEPKYMDRLEANGVIGTYPRQIKETVTHSPGLFKLLSPPDVALTGVAHGPVSEDPADTAPEDKGSTQARNHDSMLGMFDYGYLDLSPDLFLNLGPGDFDSTSIT